MKFRTDPFEGYKLGSAFRGDMMIGISKKKLEEVKEKGCELQVENRKSDVLEYMIFRGDEIPEAFGEFHDKFRDGEKYTLCYFRWKPLKQLSFA